MRTAEAYSLHRTSAQQLLFRHAQADIFYQPFPPLVCLVHLQGLLLPLHQMPFSHSPVMIDYCFRQAVMLSARMMLHLRMSGFVAHRSDVASLMRLAT